MKLQNKKIAYCYLVSNEGRDFHLLLPFIYYLEKFENFKVTFEFAWDGLKMRKHRPDLVILPNVRGHNLYYEIGKYCSENNILLYHNDSEGNFNTSPEYNYWGYNKARELLSPVQFTWNNRVKNYLIKEYNIAPQKLFVSGAPGFDKYKFQSQTKKEEILSKYGLDNYKKVVGYAGWAFGKIYNSEAKDLLDHLKMPHDIGVNWLKTQREIVESALKSAIESNPDILFILKKHPRENFESDYRDSRNEMNQLMEFPNVLYLKDQEEIQDLIMISDLWMAFESTSIMEAWLLDKPTLMIQPDPDFVKSNICEGSLLVRTQQEFLKAFEELFINENVAYFNDANVIKNRNQIIENSIGFADGLNHLRCAKGFKPYLDSLEPSNLKTSFNGKFLRLYLLLHIGKYFYIPWLFKRLPKLKKTVWVFENYNLEKIKNSRAHNFKLLDHFYELNNLKDQVKNNEIWEKL
jgi:surface carbohydrate biosynthesis protein